MSKEYDRLRAEKVYSDFKKRRELLFNKLGGICESCGKKSHKGFHLHHKYYHPTESSYPRNSKSMSTRLKRLSEAENNPERFKLLCGSCHGMEHGRGSLTTPLNVANPFAAQYMVSFLY